MTGCYPKIHPDFRLVGEVIGKLCEHCHHTNIVHDTNAGVCRLCEMGDAIARLNAAIERLPNR